MDVKYSYYSVQTREDPGEDPGEDLGEDPGEDPGDHQEMTMEMIPEMSHVELTSRSNMKLDR